MTAHEGGSPLTAYHLLPARARRRLELGRGGRWAAGLLAAAGVLPAAALGFLLYKLAVFAWPAVRFNGWHFLTGRVFSFGNLYGGAVVVHHGYRAAHGASFGILPLVFGTLASSLMAVALAVPVSVAGALLLVEKLPPRLQALLGVFLQLLAGIPSVVFGLWGVYTFGPLMSRTVYRWIAELHLPWLSGPVGSGQGLLTASLVLALMIVPVVASVSKELASSVPRASKEAALALGLTGSEMVRAVTLPYIRSGLLAASLLGWGRALGETIAVLLISGNALNIFPHDIFAPFSTMAATIAAVLDGALTDSTGMALRSLAEIGLALLVLTMATNLTGRLLVRRFDDAGLPVGRGV